MRFLIYVLSFGETYYDYARMTVSSILEIGEWPHDIVVLGDTDRPFPGRATTVVNMRSDLVARYPWLAPRPLGLWISHVKAEVEYYVDLRRYDYVLYLDSDVLVNSNRLPGIVDALWREGIIGVMQDVPAQHVARGYPTAGGRILGEQERQRWGCYRINAGILGFPTSALGRRFLRDWRRMNVAYRYASNDQANLIALLLRTYYGRWGYVDDAIHGREVRRYPQTFLHITRNKDALIRPYYEQVLGLRLPA